MANTDILVAKESFATTLDGESVSIQKGITRVRAGHKLARKHPQFFEPLTVHYDVEQATARPEEARGAPASAPSAAKAAPKAEAPKDAPKGAPANADAK